MLTREAPVISSPGFVRVTVVGWSESGLPLVQLSELEDPVEAQMLAQVHDQDIDRAIAGETLAYAQLVEGEPPLIVGVTRTGRSTVASGARWTLVEDDGKVVVEAAESLELRCGEASITLRADGKIQVRGVDVTTRARRTQRIRGGTVLIN